MEVIEVKPDQVPIARPRCSELVEALMIARLPGPQIRHVWPLSLISPLFLPPLTHVQLVIAASVAAL